jgi:hypothetical protein
VTGIGHNLPQEAGRGEAVDAATYYFRTMPRFETAHPAYAFLNRVVAVVIHVTFTGVRDDANHDFRIVPRFETAAPKYAFLNRLLAVGIGEIRPEGPVPLIEEIL